MSDNLQAPGGYAKLEPHRGTLILVLGILSLVICLPVGIAAWIMGSSDLAAMRQGRMDPSGETLTRIGQILGIIASVLIVISLALFALGIVGVVLGGGR